ncbi:MAG: reverse transcriptase N-terminal domain-containing protein [Hormoscilla sp. GM7CHS1pb]|nr:reverse transcriptase N-terminal domain-containing protein [Hormoscilla sp. GM7CHS1pb]
MSSNTDVIDTEPKAIAPQVPMDEWKTIPWRKLERRVYKLQKRIYQAASRGIATMKRLHMMVVSALSRLK